MRREHETNLTGRCLCGAVQFKASSPLLMGNCYCEDCRRVTGSGFSPVIAVPIDRLEVTGALSWFKYTNDQDLWVKRGFCSTCGSPLVGHLEKTPGIAALYAGSIDQPEVFDPALNLWAIRAPSWARPDTSIPTYDKNAPITDEAYAAIRAFYAEMESRASSA
jgi:hypothetical protein